MARIPEAAAPADPGGVVDDGVDWRTPQAELEARAYWALPHGAPDPLAGRPIPVWYYFWLD